MDISESRFQETVEPYIASPNHVRPTKVAYSDAARGVYLFQGDCLEIMEETLQQLAVGRLSALAFDRAIHGRVEQVYRDGVLIAERQVPSDKLLMWLLARLDPKRFAAPWERRKDDDSDPQSEAQQAFPTMLEALTDVAAD